MGWESLDFFFHDSSPHTTLLIFILLVIHSVWKHQTSFSRWRILRAWSEQKKEANMWIYDYYILMWFDLNLFDWSWHDLSVELLREVQSCGWKEKIKAENVNWGRHNENLRRNQAWKVQPSTRNFTQQWAKPDDKTIQHCQQERRIYINSKSFFSNKQFQFRYYVCFVRMCWGGGGKGRLKSFFNLTDLTGWNKVLENFFIRHFVSFFLRREKRREEWATKSSVEYQKLSRCE